MDKTTEQFLVAFIKEVREIKEEIKSMNTGIDILSYNLIDIEKAIHERDGCKQD